MHRKMNRAMSRDRKCTHSTCNGHEHVYKARRIDVQGPFIIFDLMSWYGMPARPITLQCRHEKNENGNVARNVCVNSVVCLPEFCSLRYQEHHAHVSNKMTMSLLAASVDMSRTFKVAVSFASTFQCASRTFFLERSRGPFRGGVV